MGRRIKQRDLAIIETVLTVLGLTALGFSGWYDWGHYDFIAVLLLIVGVILIGSNPAIAGYVKVESEEAAAATARLNEREEALATLVDLTHTFFDDVDKSADVRVTLLVVDGQWEPSRLEPIARCENSGRRPAGEHGMTEHQGVAGEAYRTRQTTIADFEPGQFEAAMMKLGFTKEEVKRFDPRGTYLCTPVSDSLGNVIAVISVDAKQPGTFDKEVHRKLVEKFSPFYTRFLTTKE